jgi:prephenate dehydratase
MKIVGEHYTKIEHCLMTVPCVQKEECIKKIKKVLSHPKALEQCSYFFQKHPWIEAVVHVDTAAAAAEIAALKDPAYGAIASESAATIYGLEIIQKGIEDDPSNYTRFVTVAKEQSLDEHANKCSLVMQLKHLPGSLAKALEQFADQGLNLTKIESRPQRGSPFKYHFYVDFEFIGRTQQEIQCLLDGLTHVQKLTVLGFYKRGTPWMT